MTRMVDRPLIYCAGPYTNPDPVANTREAILTADLLTATGLCVAYAPHVSLLQHLIEPHDLDYWYEYDLALLARCDALYRFGASSTGADAEVEFARARGIPVFMNRDTLRLWLLERM